MRKSIAAIVIVIILAIELLLFVNSSPPNVRDLVLPGGGTPNADAAKTKQDRNFFILIGVTFAVGTIITISISNKASSSDHK